MAGRVGPLWLPAEHLVTHGVVVGMTGSGKTGLLTVMIEEAAKARVPTLVIDVKGDLPNLLLAFPSFEPRWFEPWVERERDELGAELGAEVVAARAAELAERQRAALGEWGVGEAELAAYVAGTRVRVLTPGGSAGEPLHLLSALERRGARWDEDPEAARDALSAAAASEAPPPAAAPAPAPAEPPASAQPSP